MQQCIDWNNRNSNLPNWTYGMTLKINKSMFLFFHSMFAMHMANIAIWTEAIVRAKILLLYACVNAQFSLSLSFSSIILNNKSAFSEKKSYAQYLACSVTINRLKMVMWRWWWIFHHFFFLSIYSICCTHLLFIFNCNEWCWENSNAEINSNSTDSERCREQKRKKNCVKIVSQPKQ